MMSKIFEIIDYGLNEARNNITRANLPLKLSEEKINNIDDLKLHRSTQIVIALVFSTIYFTIYSSYLIYTIK